MVVVGAARSGVAAALLLAKRGGFVTLTEARRSFSDMQRLTDAGVGIETGGHQVATFAAAELVVVSPGVPLGQPINEGQPDIGRSRY